MQLIAASLFTLLSAFAVLFQGALVLGAPWGHLANGGRFPGKLPPFMRAVALLQIGLLLLFALVITTRAGLTFPAGREAAQGLQWWVVGFCALSTLVNLATPSPGERRLWAPIAVVMLGCSLAVALG